MSNDHSNRASFYAGYFTALQDVVRDTGAASWGHVRRMIENLTWKAAHDAIQDTEKEVKVPDAET